MDLAALVAEDNVGGASSVKGADATAIYQDQSSVLHPGMAEYFNKGMFSDVFIVGPDGRKLSCHQVVLSAGSKKFASILEQGVLQADRELPVWGVDSDALESVVRCFYTGECSLNAGNVVPVMDASQRLDIAPLANFCEAFVNEVLEPGTVCALLEQAMHFKMDDLTSTVLRYSESCLPELANMDEYLRADVTVITKLLAHHKSEGDPAAVLKAGWEWLVADIAHNAYAQDIAAVLPLPDGLRADDLVDRAKAAEHNITWRQPEPTPPPSPKEEKPILHTGTGLPDLSTLVPGTLAHQLVMLQQSGLIGGQLPLNLLMGLQNATGLANLTSALQSLTNAAAATDGAAAPATPTAGTNTTLLGQLLANLPGAANALGASWNQAQLLSDLVSQLTSPGGAFALGGDLAARIADLQQQIQQQQAQANRNIKKAPITPKIEEEDAAAAAAAANGANNSAAKRASAASRAAGARGMCQVEACNTDLSSLRDYHQRYKICEYHLKIPSVMKDGVLQRFCQQCGRFQPLSEFDGNKRSCKARLQRHNDRRRKRLEEEPSASYPTSKRSARSEDDIAPPPPPLSPLSAAALQRGGSGINPAAALSAVAAAASGRNWGSSLPNLQMLAELMNRVGSGAALTAAAAAAAAASPASQGNGTPTPPPTGGTPPPSETAPSAAVIGADEAAKPLEGEAVEAV